MSSVPAKPRPPRYSPVIDDLLSKHQGRPRHLRLIYGIRDHRSTHESWGIAAEDRGNVPLRQARRAAIASLQRRQPLCRSRLVRRDRSTHERRTRKTLTTSIWWPQRDSHAFEECLLLRRREDHGAGGRGNASLWFERHREDVHGRSRGGDRMVARPEASTVKRPAGRAVQR